MNPLLSLVLSEEKENKNITTKEEDYQKIIRDMVDFDYESNTELLENRWSTWN